MGEISGKEQGEGRWRKWREPSDHDADLTPGKEQGKEERRVRYGESQCQHSSERVWSD